jgi:molybdopterin/thiamine biosynthesis adenylyltransferase
LNKLNPDVSVRAVKQKLTGKQLDLEVINADVVLDCSDNFSTRFAINNACVQHQTALVSGAAIRFEGQVSVFTPGKNNSPCYNCLYNSGDEELENCATNGVIAPITGIVGQHSGIGSDEANYGYWRNLDRAIIVTRWLNNGMEHHEAKEKPQVSDLQYVSQVSVT